MTSNHPYFPHTWEDDPRESIASMTLPDESGTTFDVYLPSGLYWCEVLIFVHLQAIFSAITGLLIYKFVVQHKKYDSNVALLLGYGFLIPFWIYQPQAMIRIANIRHLIFRFVTGCVIPTLCIFRTTEAIHGFAPSHTTKSMSSYICYFVSPMVWVADAKGNYIKASFQDMRTHIQSFVLYVAATGLFQSLLVVFPDWSPFEAPDTQETWHDVSFVYSWKMWCNNFIVGMLFMSYLTTYCEGFIMFLTILTGFKMKPVMQNPMFTATSPADFWGRRWNLLVHQVLKNGVYKPVRKRTSSPKLATLAAFVASGVFHEWLLLCIFVAIEGEPKPYPVIHGGALAFFAWQAMLIVVEGLIGHWTVFETLSKTLPSAVRSVLIVALGLPFVHWFSEPYMRSAFYHSGMMGLLTVAKR